MYEIRALTALDIPAIKAFTDEAIGEGYYAVCEIEDIIQRSAFSGRMCSFGLTRGAQIFGIRLSYPPGQWSTGKGKGLHPERWPHPQNQTAYFQSLFLHPQVQGQGWGAQLSQKSLGVLTEIGAKGVVCHSWKESPHNSSQKYLIKLGFRLIAEHPLYWKDVDYNCSRCLKPPCLCTAQEMYLDLQMNQENT